MVVSKIASLLVLSSASLACTARPIDIDASSSTIRSSSEPGVLAVVHERVEKLAVYGQRLYWTSTVTRDRTTIPWFLRSCETQNCAATLVTYDEQEQSSRNDFAVVGDQIYWFVLSTAQILTCPVAGCVGPPRELVNDFYYPISPVFDGSELYFIAPANRVSIDRIPMQGDTKRQLVANVPGTTPPAGKLAIYDAHAYWLTQNETGSQTSLLRTRKDGSSSVVESISSDVRHSDNHEFGTAADATSIYWTNNLLNGSIQRCPLTGCTGASETILAPLQSPQALQIDGSELYYVHEQAPYQYAVSSCSATACTPSEPLLEQLTGPNVVAMDDQYLYAATTEQALDPTSIGSVTSQIHRLSKADRSSP